MHGRDARVGLGNDDIVWPRRLGDGRVVSCLRVTVSNSRLADARGIKPLCRTRDYLAEDRLSGCLGVFHNRARRLATARVTGVAGVGKVWRF